MNDLLAVIFKFSNWCLIILLVIGFVCSCGTNINLRILIVSSNGSISRAFITMDVECHLVRCSARYIIVASSEVSSL